MRIYELGSPLWLGRDPICCCCSSPYILLGRLCSNVIFGWHFWRWVVRRSRLSMAVKPVSAMIIMRHPPEKSGQGSHLYNCTNVWKEGMKGPILGIWRLFKSPSPPNLYEITFNVWVRPQLSPRQPRGPGIFTSLCRHRPMAQLMTYTFLSNP